LAIHFSSDVEAHHAMDTAALNPAKLDWSYLPDDSDDPGSFWLPEQAKHTANGRTGWRVDAARLRADRTAASHPNHWE
jgi:hypothetical protein